MRNETLKNLLLTASLISASAFLTACGDSTKDPVKDQSMIDGEQGKKDPIQPDSKLAEELSELKGADINLDNAAKDLQQTVEEELPPAPLPDAPAPSTPLSDFEKFSAEVSKLLPTTVEGGIVKYLRPESIATPMAIGLRPLNLEPRGYAKAQELIPLKEKSLAGAKAVYDKRKTDLITLRTQQKTVSAAFEVVMSTGTTQEKAKAKATFLKVAPFIQEYEVALLQAADVLKHSESLIAEDKQYATNCVLALMGDSTNPLPDAASVLRATANRLVFDALFNLARKLGDKKSLSTFPPFLNGQTPEQVATFFKENIDLFKAGNLNTVVDKLYTMVSANLYYRLPKKTVDSLGEKVTLADYLGSTIALTVDEKALVVSDLKAALKKSLDIEQINIFFKEFMPANDGTAAATAAAEAASLATALSSGTTHDLSSNVSLRQARTAATGSVDGSAFKMNGVAGQSVELGLPLFVQLTGDVSSAKATDATTGSVAYRLGNTVIGAIQGYANSGAGFGTDSRQLETSVVASHSFGSFFIEGQFGSVSATEVHNSNWSGLRSQVTLGLDTAFVSPFVQLTHRQLDRSGVLDLSETTAYVGLDMEVAKLAADTYSIDTRLLAKAGYGSKDWSAGSKDLGSTTGFNGSVEWSASLNLNSGVAFSSNLALDTTSGSSAGLTVSLDR